VTAKVIPFPKVWPFVVTVQQSEDGWLVVCKSHGWAFGNFREAYLDAKNIANTFGVSVTVATTIGRRRKKGGIPWIEPQSKKENSS
jgi:hypothetical protein